MEPTQDLDAMLGAAQRLVLKPRKDRWCHLSLCILDAVFSINAKYPTTVRTVHTYAAHAGMEPVLAPADEVAGGLHSASEQSLSTFVADIESLDPDEFAALLDNRQLTSTRSGIRKAEAARQYARVLLDHGVCTLRDVGDSMADADRVEAIEGALAAVPGHGSGVRVSYLWMLAGDDTHVKADRMVRRWVSKAVDRPVSAPEAAALVVHSAHALGVTPWILDHAIWTAQRRG